MDNVAFAKRLADKTQLNEEQAAKFLKAFSSLLSDYFKKGDKVVIAEFGSFFVREDKSVQFNPSAFLKSVIE